MIENYLNQVAQVKREGAVVFYDGPAAASLDLNMTEVGRDFKVKIILSDGEACTGVVSLVGEIDGTPRNEDREWHTCRMYYSDYTYDKLTSVSTSGLADEDPIPNIKLVAVDEGYVEIVTTTWEDFACRWEDKSIAYWNDIGEFTLSDAKVMCIEPIETGDHIRLYPSTHTLGYAVLKVKPATDLPGDEVFRTLLL